MIKSLINLFSNRTSAARQEMFNQSEAGRVLAAPQPKHQVIDCSYVNAMRQGFKGTAAHWIMVKENYVESLSKTLPIDQSIDCNNILFDGQGMQDADGNWHR